MSSPLHETGQLFLLVIHRCIFMAFHPLYPFVADWQHLEQSGLWQQLPHGSYHIVNETCLTPVASFLPAYWFNGNRQVFRPVCLVLSAVGVHGAGELAACRRGLQECDGHSDALPQ